MISVDAVERSLQSHWQGTQQIARKVGTKDLAEVKAELDALVDQGRAEYQAEPINGAIYASRHVYRRGISPT